MPNIKTAAGAKSVLEDLAGGAPLTPEAREALRALLDAIGQETFDNLASQVASDYVPYSGATGPLEIGMIVSPEDADIFANVQAGIYQGQNFNLNLSSGSLFNTDTEVEVADFGMRRLHGALGETSIDYQVRQLLSSVGVQALDWEIGHMWSTTDGNLSVDWTARTLYGAYGNPLLAWQNYVQIFASDLSEAANFDLRYLSDGSNISLDWVQRLLFDASGNQSIDWINRLLMDETTNVTIDYQNHQLYGDTGSGYIPMATWQCVGALPNFKLEPTGYFSVGSDDGITENIDLSTASTLQVVGGIIVGYT
jgi:hypothetical protein